MSLYHKDPSEYNRTFGVIEEYIESAITNAMLEHGYKEDEARKLITDHVGKGKLIEPKPIEMDILCRPAPLADRQERTINFEQFENYIKKKDMIVSPSWVAYEPPERFEAHEPSVTRKLKADRKVIKAAMFKAKMEKDKDKESDLNDDQSNVKTLNNSGSGAANSPHNPSWAPSLHTSLTSNCRVSTNSADTITERMLTGRRHYYSYDITIESIISTLKLVDLDLVEQAMYHYNLDYPTPEYVFERFYESKMYWNSPNKWGKVREKIFKCSPVELAALVYTTDLRTHRDLSPEFTRRMLDDIMAMNKPVEMTDIAEAKSYIKSADDYIKMLSCSLAGERLMGIDLNKSETEHPEVYLFVADRIKNLIDVITKKYWLWVNAFMRTEYMPQSVYYYPFSIRDSVQGGDTDSCMMTTRDMIGWYFGKEETFGHEANCLREAVTYLVTQSTAHCLAIQCKQMGVRDKWLFDLYMKPEFSFLVMGFTNRMKHYWAAVAACEGNIYEELELETKGVGMKNSKVTRAVIAVSNAFIVDTYERMISGNKYNILQPSALVGYVEHTLIDRLLKGQNGYLLNGSVRAPDSYKKGGLDSVFFHQRFWTEVMAPKYGAFGDVPVDCKKVSLALNNRTDLREWFSSMEPAIAERAKNFFEREGRTSFNVCMVPSWYLKDRRIPEELIRAMNTDTFLKDLMESFYYHLEVLGIYYVDNINKKNRYRYVYKEMDYETCKANLPFDVDALLK